MYSSTPSLSLSTSSSSSALAKSVLAQFPPDAAHAVVTAVVKSISNRLGIGVVVPGVPSGTTLTAAGVTEPVSSSSGAGSAAEPPALHNEAQITWFMEVVCHGLSLPLAEHETVKDCVNIYCEWLSALMPVSKPCIPQPILDEPNRYARKIIGHLFHLFVPRKAEAQETIHKQAVLCHRVLRRIQDVVQQSRIMDRVTWEALLVFLLAINDALLAPPAVKDDVGDQLCERVLGVLYEIWLAACVKCFPSPPLWKTFREMCMNWRHRTGLVDQWNRVNLALTSRLLSFMYDKDIPKMRISEEDESLIPADMTNDCIAQSWYRFLHSLGNPVDLSRPAIVSQTQHFYQYAIVAENVIDPTHHPCLSALPSIFMKAMKGVSAMVDAYLGLPPGSTGLNRSSSTTLTNSTSVGSSPNIMDFTGMHMSASARPNARCNSLLHLFGKWLFEAAYIDTAFSAAATQSAENVMRSMAGSPAVVETGSRNCGSAGDNHAPPPSTPPPALMLPPHAAPPPHSEHAHGNQPHPPSGLPLRRTTSSSTHHIAAVPASSSSSLGSSMNNGSLELPTALTPERFEAGRAEAIGALCRIFCSKKTGEEILPVYLARFYLAVQQGLVIPPEKVVSEVLVMLMVNSIDLLRLDLEGVHILLPYLVTALEVILPERDLKMRSTNVTKNEVRRAGIKILVSMLGLPSHFQNLQIKELLPGCSKRDPITFGSLKPRLFHLAINALQVEEDACNTHILLGGLMFLVQDTLVLENMESELEDRQPQNPSAEFEKSSADSGHALFIRATYLVCHRLISTWKTDLNTSLAALELLSGLARVKVTELDPLESKRAVKWICDYIVAQCSRPPPAHSKDLHSSIVAAFRCLQTWLLCHSYLLQDKDCIATAMEVVEQGISGSKSRNRPNSSSSEDSPVYKENKVLNPASGRVKDAAEALLTCLLEQVDYFPSACGAESISTLLDEASILRHCNALLGPDDVVPMSEAIQNYRYFVIDNSTILAVLEEPLGNDQEPHLQGASVTLLLRTYAGRTAWTMQLRHLPRHKSGLIKNTQVNPGRPLPITDGAATASTSFAGGSVGVAGLQPKFFPESIDQIPLCKADKSIPAVESVAGDERAVQELEHLSRLTERQAILEEQVIAKKGGDAAGYRVDGECLAPEPVQDFQTARLVLSHLGLLNLASLRENTDSSGMSPRLIALETDDVAFANDLEALDRTSPRTADTAHIFYVKSGQTTSEEILHNVHSSTFVHPHFLAFLSTLGWPVNVWQHPGWTGHISTSWKGDMIEPMAPPVWNDHGGAMFNGDHHVLYWAEASSEFAFVVPSNRPETAFGMTSMSYGGHDNQSLKAGRASPYGHDRSTTAASTTTATGPSGGGSAAAAPPEVAKRRIQRQTSTALQAEAKMVIVWLERMEDSVDIPLDNLLAHTRTGNEAGGFAPSQKDTFVIYIQPMKSGLMMIRMQGQIARINLALPLVDGMVITRRCLGPLVRQTLLNYAVRRRLEVDSYQPPHVKRRLKVQEIVQKFRSHMTEAELYTHLFNPPFH